MLPWLAGDHDMTPGPQHQHPPCQQRNFPQNRQKKTRDRSEIRQQITSHEKPRNTCIPDTSLRNPFVCLS
ncbi:hypothetical protein EAF00_011347 [Botryotinia globosa]|nr:hypothetical protein EAF00_011347 [Botryotinia globosa]